MSIFKNLIREQFFVFRLQTEALISSLTAKSPTARGVEVLVKLWMKRKTVGKQACRDYYRAGHHDLTGVTVKSLAMRRSHNESHCVSLHIQ